MLTTEQENLIKREIADYCRTSVEDKIRLLVLSNTDKDIQKYVRGIVQEELQKLMRETENTFVLAVADGIMKALSRKLSS